MNINIYKSFVLFLLSSILLNACSQKNNNIDLSNLPVIKQKDVVDTKKESKDEVNLDEFIEDLSLFNSSEQLLSKFKIGKKNPFSEGESKVNKFTSDFKLTGFLDTKTDSYVFVSYQGNKGTISEDSIGGSNTNLLPNGAKVVNIDSKKKKLKINFDNEVYIFEF